jgi:hypothetical protein
MERWLPRPLSLLFPPGWMTVAGRNDRQRFDDDDARGGRGQAVLVGGDVVDGVGGRR